MNKFIKNQKVTICGLGIIGLPLMALLSSKNIDVHGFDIDRAKLNKIKRNELKFNEKELDDLVEKFIVKKRINISTTLTKSEVYIICVPTPINKNKKFDSFYIESCFKTIIPILNVNDLIIIESTCEPNTTQKIYKNIKKNRPDLFKKKSKIFVAYCPETILPGNIINELKFNNRIIGGIDKESAAYASNLYRLINKKKQIITNDIYAEYAKLIQNSYRDVNIAFANEVDLMLRKNNIKSDKIINIANEHPRVNILNPKIGVGGHCIPVDPWFLINQDRKNTKIIKYARKINSDRPKFISSFLYNKILKQKNVKKICFCGLSYKENSSDLRESPSLELVKIFKKRYKKFDIRVHDPSINKNIKIDGNLLKYIKYNNILKWSDMVIISVHHDIYLKQKKFIKSTKILKIPNDL